MRIDSHQHFWRYNEREYGWMGDGMECLKQDHLPEHLFPLLKDAGFDGSIAVQARQSLEETRWLLELSDRFSWIRAVVGWVDLRSTEVGDQLERFASHPKFRAVRHVVHDEPDDRFLMRDDLLRGIGQLAALNLVYDLLLFPRHLPIACDFVSRFPRQRFVLDHIAKPPIRSRQVDNWAYDIRRLAEFPNVFCKLSGMVTEADWQRWQTGDFTPYLDVVVDAFGVERLMIGSDWPVCTIAASYAETMQPVREYLERLGPEAGKAILGGNAARCYDIALAPADAAGGDGGRS